MMAAYFDTCHDCQTGRDELCAECLMAENKRLREGLEKVYNAGYGENCMACGYKDRIAKQALEGGE